MASLKVFKPQRREPMPPGGVLVSEWAVGRRTVRIVQDVSTALGVGALRCEWRPDTPRRLSKREWREYRAGRDAHHQRVADIIGAPVASAEL